MVFLEKLCHWGVAFEVSNKSMRLSLSLCLSLSLSLSLDTYFLRLGPTMPQYVFILANFICKGLLPHKVLSEVPRMEPRGF